MTYREQESHALRKWIAVYLGVNFRDEGCYDNAIQAAEHLHACGLVSSAELIDMIKRANVSLLCLEG
ncbi:MULTISPECIES: hypothetical protein [unclassified Pseudomonas]|jgi:hypothetical protein|uniref:hypothetical protein n=1 Tax=unclassified Pseudomonas TaxID=196821 RepID=UPI0007616E90|nr:MULTISPECIES: hypothetical protein [unclassified Pseudomonas]KYC16496.1 hypothetical protein WM94_23610 [Pseudomonas sp. ABFPK]